MSQWYCLIVSLQACLYTVGGSSFIMIAIVADVCALRIPAAVFLVYCKGIRHSYSNHLVGCKLVDEDLTGRLDS